MNFSSIAVDGLLSLLFYSVINIFINQHDDLNLLANVGKKPVGESGHFPDAFQILLLAWFFPINTFFRMFLFLGLIMPVASKQLN
uniref:hypothetical protein n=1 Tax=Crenothrix polyspora TaxID=360316 RepID=UPI000B363F6C|nr:hypothetical protein [Crenothrix polyspora]